MLLPTEYYLAGGTLAVAVSFGILALVPVWTLGSGPRINIRALRSITGVDTLLSCGSFLFFLFLIYAGIGGSRDPLANPLPLTIWTIWWIGLTLLHAVFGNLWYALNPWSGPFRLLKRLARRNNKEHRPLLRLPVGLGYWPAVAGFLGFAWFELVYIAPDDPGRLAFAALFYWTATFAGILVFGEKDWLARGECFAVLFRLISRLSPIFCLRTNAGSVVAISVPGARLVGAPILPLSGALFVLLTLSSVSFDGLRKTFWWLGLNGINPLEFPGRSAVVGLNTFGLLAMWTALSTAYLALVWLGWAIAGRNGDLRESIGSLVLSIIPIALGFHFAHNLPTLLLNGQYAFAAASDPLGKGMDLFGLGAFHPTASFLATYDQVAIIWKLQVASIVAGHILAVVIAHHIALRICRDAKSAVLSLIPLAILMVLYTLFGLWLLATPTGA